MESLEANVSYELILWKKAFEHIIQLSLGKLSAKHFNNLDGRFCGVFMITHGIILNK